MSVVLSVYLLSIPCLRICLPDFRSICLFRWVFWTCLCWPPWRFSYVYLYVLSIDLSPTYSVHLSTYIYLPERADHVSVGFPVVLLVCLFVCLFICLSICLSICLLIYLSVYLSVLTMSLLASLASPLSLRLTRKQSSEMVRPARWGVNQGHPAQRSLSTISCVHCTCMDEVKKQKAIQLRLTKNKDAELNTVWLKGHTAQGHTTQGQTAGQEDRIYWRSQTA